MIRVISIVALLITFNYSFGQSNTFRAVAIEAESNEPIVGAKFYFEELKKGAISDLDGKIEITGIPDGEHEIEISMHGFQEIDTTHFHSHLEQMT